MLYLSTLSLFIKVELTLKRNFVLEKVSFRLVRIAKPKRLRLHGKPGANLSLPHMAEKEGFLTRFACQNDIVLFSVKFIMWAQS